MIRNQEAYLVDEDTGEVLTGLYAGIAGEDFDFSYGIARHITRDCTGNGSGGKSI